jgi:hypothetical protein
MSNGVYSILDKFGVAIPPNGTSTDRVGQLIEVTPVDPTTGGIYFLQVNSSETEHILIFDNSTSFGDTIYNPLLRVRQARLRFNGFRSNGWYGKMEAPGYLVMANQLVPNFDTIVDAMRYYYDPDTTIDNPSLEDLGRHLIGYESKSYLDNLQVSNDVQYLFYQGAIRQKGTIQSFDKLFRSTKVRGNETIEVYEEWALKLGNFGNTVEQVSTEFTLIPEQDSGEVIVARLNYIPSTIGFVKQISILNAQNVYTNVPKLIISPPDANPLDINLTAPLRQAKAYVVLDISGIISRIDITDAGYGYLVAPTIDINSGIEPHQLDKLYAVWQGEIIRDASVDNIIEIDIDDTTLWTTRPTDPAYSLEFPTTNIIDYPLPNAGYVNFDDIVWSAFDNNEIFARWGTTSLNPVENDTIWVAKTFTEDWDVYKMINTNLLSYGDVNQRFDIIKDTNGSLLLRTPYSYLITPQLSPNGHTTDLGNLISLQVIEAHAIATTESSSVPATGSALVPSTATASVTAISSSGGVATLSITASGAGYDFVPTVLVASPPVQGSAVAQAVLTAGAVTHINVVSGGTGYMSIPTVSIAAPGLVKATATSTISGGSVTGLVIDNPGAGYIVPPLVTVKSANLNYATALGHISGGGVSSITPVTGGSGYTVAPTVSVASPLLINASASATVSGGGVSLSLINGGAGYGTIPSVTVGAPTYINATATSSVSAGGVTVINPGNPGAGYATAPSVTIAAPLMINALASSTVSGGLLATISSVNVGAGYGTAPSITVAPPTLTQAAVTAVLDSSGSISSIVFVNHGAGYSGSPSITVPPPTLTQASATPVVSGGVIIGFNFNSQGSGYVVSSSVTITGSNTTPANVTTIVTNGMVTGFNIISGGTGYTTPSASIATPTGTGAVLTIITLNGTVSSVGISTPGGGYTSSPTITIAAPTGVAGTAHCTVANGVISGYVIDTVGNGYTTPPTIIVGPPNGTTATAFATVANGVVTAYSMYFDGSGYTTAPVVTVGAPDGASATASATISGGMVSGFIVSYAGTGYTSAPYVIIGSPNGLTAVYTANTPVAGAITGYTLVNAGTGYTTVPDITVGSPGGTQAVFTANISGAGIVTGFNLVNAGSGYTTPPIVTIASPPGSTATATATIAGGVVTGFNIINQGGGYTSLPVITIGSGSGSSTTATASASITTGVVSHISILDPGSGYISSPAITIQQPAGNRTVQSIAITNAGTHYVTAPAVHITGDGSSAAAHTTILNGLVDTITVDNHGTNYTYANVTIDLPPSSTLGAISSITITQVGSGYTTAPTVTITDDAGPMFGHGATAIAQISGGIVTNIVITAPGTGYLLPVITLSAPLAVNPVTNYTVGFAFNSSDSVYNYYNLLSLIGVALTENEVPDYLNFTKLMLFKTMRFATEPNVGTPTYVSLGDKIWVDNINLTPTLWNVYSVVTPSTLYPKGHKLFRQQEPLINTSLFESARIYATDTQDELALMPIYDPFKNILPALAKQNISYMSLSDPTHYNVTGDTRLYNANISFGEAQVGQLWWDLSNIRYVYYEQPIALDGSETPTQNLVYRRDRWGQIFPGSTADIYEWTKSPVPPAEYTGSGIPKSLTDYVQITTSNRFTNITQTNYYFWVIGTTDQPNIENRTLAAINVARLLMSPRSQQVEFFAPIQQTLHNNSYMFYNVQEILIWRGNKVQIQYRLAEREDQKHTQWRFFREGDKSSVVTTQFWDKMVDSLCGYTKLLPVSNEWDGIFIAANLPWDIYGWDIAPWDDATSTSSPIYGEILPVPDPALSEAEKYGISYRPRQGMFMDLYAARKIFVQSANNLLQHIPIRDDNPTWNTGVTSDVYWTYTTWYEVGFDNVIPTVIFTTVTLAQNALTAGLLATGTIVQVVDGTIDGRFIIYNVEQADPNVPVQSFQLVGIEASAISLLTTIYTTHNVYGLSTELRQLLNAFRTEVFINSNIVDQNELYFSLLNYVTSEQKNPDWLFKTSYIYIKENNLQLTQDPLYIPNQIDNIMNYIVDAKPYHTQIRDYTSTYLTTDIANGTATDSYKWNIKLQFGPGGTGLWDIGPWDATDWDSLNQPFIPQFLNAKTFIDNIDQIVSQENVYTIPLTIPDPAKKGYSQLYPYTFGADSIFQNPIQTFITPYNIVGIQIGSNILLYGQDYYVEFNNDNTPTSDGTYTVYFFNDPSSGPVPVALVWFDGGELLTSNEDTYRRELANGTASDDLVMNIDTKLPVNLDGGVYSAISDMWDFYDPVIDNIVQGIGGEPVGFGNGFWDQDTTTFIQVLDNTISSKENTNIDTGANFYRNADIYAGTLVIALPAPEAATENLDVITVSTVGDILPDPENGHETIWINGERIQYRLKTQISANTWELRLVQRGTMGTAPTSHDVSSKVWIERENEMPSTSNDAVWNAVDSNPDLLTETPPSSGRYTSVVSTPLGGLWYAETTEAVFLKQEQGISIP